MKKIVSSIAAALLCLSFAGPALADQIQTVSVGVPEEELEYTVTIPQDCVIEYGNTQPQSIGTIIISIPDSEQFEQRGKAIEPSITYGQLVNENGSTINCSVGPMACDDQNNVFLMSAEWSWNTRYSANVEYGIQVDDWSTAEPGTTYTLQIAYGFTIVDVYNGRA